VLDPSDIYVLTQALMHLMELFFIRHSKRNFIRVGPCSSNLFLVVVPVLYSVK
jgi:hypothetical protein